MEATSRIRGRTRPKAAQQATPPPSRLIYGFSRRAATRIQEATGAERHALALFAAILVYVGVRIWLVGAEFTILGVIHLAELAGYQIGWSAELWSIPIGITIAEVGLKRPRFDIYFLAWMIAFGFDAATTALGLLPSITAGSEMVRWAWALLAGALFAWSAEACCQAGLYSLWRYYRGTA